MLDNTSYVTNQENWLKPSQNINMCLANTIGDRRMYV